MIGYRQVDRRFPFLWEGDSQPAGRWHAGGEGPAHYFSDTPDGAWAEFLRHEEIRDPEDVYTVERALWAVDLPAEVLARPDLPERVLAGDPSTYLTCQAEARSLREAGATGLRAPSAALLLATAGGFRVEAGVQPGRSPYSFSLAFAPTWSAGSRARQVDRARIFSRAFIISALRCA